LAPVYDRFTEGFATTDLRAARALLDTLRWSMSAKCRGLQPSLVGAPTRGAGGDVKR